MPIADNAMTGDYPKYRNLWVDIREGLRDVRRGPEEAHQPPLLARIHFPEEWSVLIVQLAGTPGRHGSDEIQAFSSLPPVPDTVTERLCRLRGRAELP